MGEVLSKVSSETKQSVLSRLAADAYEYYDDTKDEFLLTLFIRLFTRSLRSTVKVIVKYGGPPLALYTTYCFFVKPFLSPLRKIPGPGYDPLFGNVREAMVGEAMSSSIGWVRKYGGIVRFYHLFGRERVLIADPEALKHIMVTNVANYKRPKFVSSIINGGIFTVSGEEHTDQRRILNPHFNRESIKFYITVFQECSKELCEVWVKKVSSNEAEINIQEDLMRMTLDVAGKSLFGHDFQCLKCPESKTIAAFRAITASGGISFTRLIPFYNKLPTKANKLLKENKAIIDKVLYGIIRQKRRTLELFGTDALRLSDVDHDLLGRLIVARYQETAEGMSDDELRDQILSLLIAGHETTGVTMSWLLLLLAQHPDVQTRVRQEIEAHVPEGEPVSWEHLSKLEYLDCVLRETQRLYPAAPSFYRVAVRDDHILGYDIPAGTQIAFHVGAMMRNPAIWSDPDSFQPERFLERELDATYTHLPFITGPHKCLGHQFAKVQIRLVVASLLREFSFSVNPQITFKRKMRVTLKADPPVTLRVKKLN